jgi:hypothetical protein
MRRLKPLFLGLVYGIFFLAPVSVVAAYLGSAMLHGAAAARFWIPLYVGCYYLGFCHAGRRLALGEKKKDALKIGEVDAAVVSDESP